MSEAINRLVTSAEGTQSFTVGACPPNQVLAIHLIAGLPTIRYRGDTNCCEAWAASCLWLSTLLLFLVFGCLRYVTTSLEPKGSRLSSPPDIPTEDVCEKLINSPTSTLNENLEDLYIYCLCITPLSIHPSQCILPTSHSQWLGGASQPPGRVHSSAFPGHVLKVAPSPITCSRWHILTTFASLEGGAPLWAAGAC